MSTAQLVFDTGPLLCFAAIPGGVKLFGDTYHGRAWTTYDVQRELRGLRSNHNPDVAEAAQLAVRRFSWLQLPEVGIADDPEAVDDMLARLDTFKTRRGTRSAFSDRGECTTILLVQHLAAAGQAVVAINETPGRMLAQSLRISSVCFAELLHGMSKAGRLTTKQAFAHYTTVTKKGLDAGKVFKSHKDFQ